MDFGNGPLSHPLLVEAIHSQFHPVVVFNNRPGNDAAVLKQYSEPAWNNPVIRWLDADGADWIPRRDGLWTVEQTADRMIEALEASGRGVPEYLRCISLPGGGLETATFAMHCFWEGEAKLGVQRGVARTRAGWADGMEIVQVDFDPGVIAFEELLGTATGLQCASAVFAHSEQQLAAAEAAGVAVRLIDRAAGQRDAEPPDQRYYLRNSQARLLPLTETQAVRINGLLGTGGDFRALLSPHQLEQLQAIEVALARDPGWGRDLQGPIPELNLAGYSKTLDNRLGTGVPGPD